MATYLLTWGLTSLESLWRMDCISSYFCSEQWGSATGIRLAEVCLLVYNSSLEKRLMSSNPLVSIMSGWLQNKSFNAKVAASRTEDSSTWHNCSRGSNSRWAWSLPPHSGRNWDKLWANAMSTRSLSSSKSSVRYGRSSARVRSCPIATAIVCKLYTAFIRRYWSSSSLS